MIPKKGHEHRARQMAALARLLHQRMTDPRIGEWLEKVEGSPLVQDPLSDAAVNVREWRRDYDRAVKIPQDLAVALAKATAEGETGHAHGHLEWLEQCGDPATGMPIGSTRQNLASAVAGETHEYTDMYPGMAKTARDEGFDEVADWFETLAKAERSHANRYQKALTELVD